MTRRGFLKLAAAGAAVAIVPVQVVEAIAPVPPEPLKIADAFTRRLWRIDRIDEEWSTDMPHLLRLSLYAGACRMEFSMCIDNGREINFGLFDAIELDVRLVDGKPRIFIDDKPVDRVQRFSVLVVPPILEFFSRSSGAVHRLPGHADIEPLQQLTAYKEWGKP